MHSSTEALLATWNERATMVLDWFAPGIAVVLTDQMVPPGFQGSMGDEIAKGMPKYHWRKQKQPNMCKSLY